MEYAALLQSLWSSTFEIGSLEWSCTEFFQKEYAKLRDIVRSVDADLFRLELRSPAERTAKAGEEADVAWVRIGRCYQ